MTSAPASTRRWLILRLEAPLLSFGAVAIDHRGVIWDFPGLSMLTGLFANALGWQRTDRQAHQSLEDRLVFAARRERESYAGTLRDTQNAKLEKSDKGWTTRGTPEGRNGASYGAPHRRQRDYHPDALITVAVTLKAAPTEVIGPAPSLDDLAGSHSSEAGNHRLADQRVVVDHHGGESRGVLRLGRHVLNQRRHPGPPSVRAACAAVRASCDYGL